MGNQKLGSNPVGTFFIGNNGRFSKTLDSAVNTAQTLTQAADADTSSKLVITGLSVFISGAVVGAADINVVLKDGATAIWKGVIGSGAARGASIIFSSQLGIQLTAGNAANLVVDAGGAAVVTTANITGYTK